MCKKLIKNNKKIELRFYEDKIKSQNSIALIKYLKKHNKFNIYFIMGSDNIISLHKWKNYRDIIKMTNIIVFSRKVLTQKQKKSVIIKRLKTKNITFIKNLQFNMSSTELKKILSMEVNQIKETIRYTLNKNKANNIVVIDLQKNLISRII